MSGMFHWRTSHPVRRLSAFWAWPGGAIVPAFLVIGTSLLFQGERYGRTPAYAILLNLLPAPVWGVAYLTIGLLFALYLAVHPTRWLAILAHTAGVTLILWWLIAFVVRYLTDTATTPVNVVSWSLYLFLLVRSAWMIDVVILSTTSTMGRDTKRDDLA
jgi:hypothetical protein